MSKDLIKIAINLQKKYNKINEIYDLTKQMQESIYRNDVYSLKMIVKMRTEVMLQVEEIENERQELLNNFPENNRRTILNSLSDKVNPEELKLFELKNINDIYMKSRRLLEKTIELDKALNLKVNSGNSEYKL